MFFIAEKQLNLFSEANNSKFVTRKWSIVNYNSKENFDIANENTYNTEVLKSNPFDYHDAYILVRGNFTIVGHHASQVTCKNFAPLT